MTQGVARDIGAQDHLKDMEKHEVKPVVEKTPAQRAMDKEMVGKDAAAFGESADAVDQLEAPQ